MNTDGKVTADEQKTISYVVRITSFIIEKRWRLIELLVAIMFVWQSKEIITYPLEVAMEDLRTSYFTPPPPDSLSNVRVVLIDRKSLEHLKQRSPVDRAFLAQILDCVLDSGPKAVGLDLTLDQHGIDPEGEKALTEVLAAARVPVVIAAPDPRTGLEADKRDAKLFIEQRNNTLLSLAPSMLHVGIGGTIRSFDLVRDQDKTFIAALAEASGAIATGEREQDIAWRGIPEPTQGQIPTLTASSLLEKPAAGKVALAGKIVLIGLNDSGHGMMVRAPFAGNKPDQSRLYIPEVYAAGHIVDQLIENRTAPRLGMVGTIFLCLTMTAIGSTLFWIKENKVNKQHRFFVNIALSVTTISYLLINGLFFKYCGSIGGPGIALPILGPILFLHDAFRFWEK